ncbi:PREDICTED: uncharacterized protein LOC109125660 [Camelina sativa]|uniref:Uncharacterized protein LOC109125660 n=1 Tax=Camelina sativa TaxID=90675 RepID=A0ABM1Q9A4_CAMSA|nr:PREDICTED: uncharacterized protein LOC109125660 [Camelina sativa]
MVFARLCPRQRLFSSWAELVSWTRLSSTPAPTLLRKLAVQVVVYNIWHQRNNVHHNSVRLSSQVVFKWIDRELRNIITARRHRKRWRKLMLLWIR